MFLSLPPKSNSFTYGNIYWKYLEQSPAPLRQRKIGIVAQATRKCQRVRSRASGTHGLWNWPILRRLEWRSPDRKSTRLNSSHVLQMKSCSRFVTEELPTLFHNSKLYIMIMDPLYHGVRHHDIRQSLPKVATSPSFLYSHLLLSITRPPVVLIQYTLGD